MSKSDPTSSQRHSSCLNCGAPLTSKYCGHCGQRDTDHVLSMHELFHELIEVLIHADSKLWRTLGVMFKQPGEITAEFVRGRRQSFTPPLRTYLVVSLLFFLTLSLTQSVQTTPSARDGAVAPIVFDTQPSAKPGTPAADPCSAENLRLELSGPRWLEPRLIVACQHIVADSGRTLVNSALRNAPKAMFLFLPLISLIAALLYVGSRRQGARRHYVEHLVFFVHHHTFAFLLLTAVLIVNAALGIIGAEAVGKILLGGVVVYLPVYLYLSMRRFYGQGRAVTAIKFALLTCAYVFCVFLTGTLAVIGTALTI